MSHTGGCLCGAVRFEATDVSDRFSACHCSMCRRWGGGGPFLAVPAKTVTFQGEEHIKRFDSSDWASRGFCDRCGTSLFYFLKPMSAHVMSLGAFDDPSPFELSREIFIDRKPACYALAGEHERWTEAETFARLKPPA